MRLSRFLLFLFLMVQIRPEMLAAEVKLSAKEWDFGIGEASVPLQFVLTLTNENETAANVDLITTCECVSVHPASVSIPPGQALPVILRLDLTGYEGEITRIVFIDFNSEQQARVRFDIRGKVIAAAQAEKTATAQPGDEQPQFTESIGGAEVRAIYYYTPGCKTCLKFLNQTVPELENRLKARLLIEKKDISDPEVLLAYSALVKQRNEQERALPALLIGNQLFQGNQEIDENLEPAFREVLLTGNTQVVTADTQNQGKAAADLLTDIRQKVTLAYTISSGLLDGINPCAFTTIIFLITSLTLAGRRRTETLIMGIFFTVSVFITYFLLGLGLFEFIRTASSFPIIASIIRWGIIGVLILFAGLSLYDFYLIKKGKEQEMILQLPTLFKKKIQTTIKSQVRRTALVTTSLSLGFLVSLFELGCTGQVLLPYVTALTFYKDLSGYAYLLLYCFFFILPLLAVFILTYVGISSRQVTSFFQKHMGLVKLMFAVLFISLAGITIIFS